MSKTAEEWVDELHHGVTVYAKDIANKRNVEIIRRIQNEALEMAAEVCVKEAIRRFGSSHAMSLNTAADHIRQLKEPT